MKVYKTYTFKDQDPLIGDVLRGSNESVSKVAERSGVSTSTLYNWRKKKSKRTFTSTLNAVAIALNKRLVVVDKGRKE